MTKHYFKVKCVTSLRWFWQCLPMLHHMMSLQSHDRRSTYDLDFRELLPPMPDSFPTPLYSCMLYSLALLILLNGFIKVYGDTMSLSVSYLSAEEVRYFDQQSFLFRTVLFLVAQLNIFFCSYTFICLFCAFLCIDMWHSTRDILLEAVLSFHCLDPRSGQQAWRPVPLIAGPSCWPL